MNPADLEIFSMRHKSQHSTLPRYLRISRESSPGELHLARAKLTWRKRSLLGANLQQKLLSESETHLVEILIKLTKSRQCWNLASASGLVSISAGFSEV